ncbi:MAG: nicotinamide-nucleotide amidohydrolase family protein [Burkholderiales bacterium]|nr:nicotinamide-nucleotide amidohydrolase family protein [Burkholderiales bacterium]
MDQALFDLAVRVGNALRQRAWMLTTAESCTGGWVGACVTMVGGSSQWYDRGFITYSNSAKMQMLGVLEETLRVHGAVSEATVAEMAQGALARSNAHVAVSISGVAGPTGGTSDKPVGSVCIGWAGREGSLRSRSLRFEGDRDAVRRRSVIVALEGVIELAGGASTSAA